MSGPELLYVNATSIADDGTSSTLRPAVAYSDSRTQPMITRSTDYRAAIIRFQCTGLDLPVYIPTILPGPDPTLTNLAVGMRLVYVGEDPPSAAIPAISYSAIARMPVYWTPSTSLAGNDYYWARSVQDVLDCVNKSIVTLVNGFNAALSAGSFNTPIALNSLEFGAQTPPQLVSAGLKSIPFCTYTKSGITINVDPNEYFNPLTLGVTQDQTQINAAIPSILTKRAWVELLFNDPLCELFNGHLFTKTQALTPMTVLPTGGAPNLTFGPKIVQATINNLPAHTTDWTSAAIRSNTSDCLNVLKFSHFDTLSLITQGTVAFLPAYDGTDAWSPVDAILFTSTMPFQPEVTSTTNFLSASQTLSGGSSNLVVPTFTDISLPLSDGPTDYRGKITYAPSAQYRWLEFTTNQALTSFNFQLLWRGRLDDKLYPVYLRPNGSVQMKLLLQRKF